MIGDTVGPGGIMRGIRHVPALIDIASNLDDISPNTYLFNYSNPLTVLTRAVIRECKVKTYGVCTGIFGVASRDVKLYIGGINHFYWVLDFTVKAIRDILSWRS
jgi:alpha-galactosidase